MTSLVARGVKLYARKVMKPAPVEPDAAVRHLRRVIDNVPMPSVLPRAVARRPLAPGELGDVTGEWVGVPAALRTVLHHHGGGYVSGRPATNRNVAGRLARGLRAQVLLAAYRLAPEHPHPAALQDALSSYRRLLDRCDPAAIAVSGDSAGGGLTLALLQRLRDEGLPLPAAGVLISPWTDLTGESPSHSGNDAADDMLSRTTLLAAAGAYLAGNDARAPSASPALGDLGGLPPLLVTVDESEVLLDDSTRVVEGVRAAGGEATLIRRSGLFHVWPVMVPYFPEARQTVNEMVAFLDRHLSKS